MVYIKNAVKNPSIIVGFYTDYFDTTETDNFEDHVTNFYPFSKDKLIIGKFCDIATGIKFVMGAANHRMNCVTTYPFYIMGSGWGSAITPQESELPEKGDTVIGNDVWIGQNVTVMPGVHIGDGAVIGARKLSIRDTTLQWIYFNT